MNPLLSSVVYSFFGYVVAIRDWRRNVVFGMMALMTLPVAMLYQLDAADTLLTPRRRMHDGTKELTE